MPKDENWMKRQRIDRMIDDVFTHLSMKCGDTYELPEIIDISGVCTDRRITQLSNWHGYMLATQKGTIDQVYINNCAEWQVKKIVNAIVTN